MKWRYTGVEPCRIGSVLVQKGDVWDHAQHPGENWEQVPDPVRTAKPPIPPFKPKEQ